MKLHVHVQWPMGAPWALALKVGTVLEEESETFLAENRRNTCKNRSVAPETPTSHRVISHLVIPRCRRAGP